VHTVDEEMAMRPEDLEIRWREVSAAVMRSMAEWRKQHPKATFREIETAVDEELSRLRARVLEDAAGASAAADLRTTIEEQMPLCPSCGTRVVYRTHEKRHLRTPHEHEVTLERSYVVCPQCGQAFFPPG